MYVASCYRFTEITETELVRVATENLCERAAVTGTVLLANEGINAVLAHPNAQVLELLVEKIQNLLQLVDLHPTLSTAQHDCRPFDKLQVRIRPEIVSFGTSFDFALPPLPKANPAEWNELVRTEDTVLLDVRNDYEHHLGRFRNSVNPNTKNFREFKNFLQRNTLINQMDQVAIYCTGGIRCEKAAQYMHKLGYESVTQLDRGVLGYLEAIDDDQNWEGECFVFDQRVAVDRTLDEGNATLCLACGSPLTAADSTSSRFELGISCPSCHHSLTKDSRARRSERVRQLKLMQQRTIDSASEPSLPSLVCTPQ